MWGIISVILFALLVIIGIHLFLRDKTAHANMSFVETMNLTGLPIATFEYEGKKYNFILDTGSNCSIIDARYANEMHYQEVKDSHRVYGLSAISKEGGYGIFHLQYKGKDYDVECDILDMKTTFDKMKECYGVTLHGVLGSDFLHTYRYVLDFNELVAYSLRK